MPDAKPHRVTLLQRSGSGRLLSADSNGRCHTLGLVYDHDPDEVKALGWEEFVLRQWESIFICYRSWTGLRTLGRRWSDLIEAGLGCSQHMADRLVKAAVINGPGSHPEGTSDAADIVSGMRDVLARIPAALTGMADLGPGATATLLGQHARLLSFIQEQVPDANDI
jgi:hypothetical protein